MTTVDRLVILGATGDLTERYLLPALAELVDAGRLPESTGIVGLAREPWDTPPFRRHASEALDRHAAGVPSSARQALVER
ncbi:MAG: glucose-6-phosphate dehydrogenase, partial [Acidimicrobiia bacterium]